MICGNCNYKEILGDTGFVKCLLTGETRLLGYECNCEAFRAKKDRAADVAINKETVLTDLTALRDRVSKGEARANLQHILDILTDTSKDSNEKITEVIEYLEDFV